MWRKTPSQDLNSKINAKQQDDWWFGETMAANCPGGESFIFRTRKIDHKKWTSILSSR